MSFEVSQALHGRVHGGPPRGRGASFTPTVEARSPAAPRDAVEIEGSPQPLSGGRLAHLAHTSLMVGGLAALTVAATPVLAVRAAATLVGKIGARLAFGIGKGAQREHPPQTYAERYGPWGLVTGASSGIGAEFARDIAARGLNVVMVARRGDRLEKLAEELREKHGVQVRTVSADLADPDFMKPIEAATKDLDVGLVVNNAGTWEFGPMLDHGLDSEMRVLEVNTRAPLVLSHTFGRKMAERGRGGIVMVSSGAAYQGVPNQTNYAATKAYLLSLAEGLSAEWKPQGVDVLCTTPGPVHTEGAADVDFSRQPLPPVTARAVAVDALSQLGKKTTTAPGFLTRWAFRVQQAMFSRDLNSSVAGELFGRAIGKTDSSRPLVKAADAEQTSPPAGSDTAPVKAETAGSAVALEAATAAVPGSPSLVSRLLKPLTSLVGTARFARNFMGDLRRRAEEITAKPGVVEDNLLAKGLHKPYQEPTTHTTAKLEGRLYVKASMAEFFELWSSWIEQGKGSVSDRQYADVLLEYRDEARKLPLLQYVPMTSEDTFAVDIKDGKIQTMGETTINKFAGLVPTAKVGWMYQRTQQPRVANSFEHAVDQFNGDLQAVEAHYNHVFDPRRLNPDSKAIVKFELRQVDSLPTQATPGLEYEHSVSLLGGALIPHPETTLRS